jgi:hypothetical protein
VVTVSFVDPGLLSLASFETHLLAYGQLFCAVPQLNFVYIGTRPTHFETARRLCLAMALCSMNPDRGVEGLRYFHYRHVWERKEYSKLNTDQIEFLNEATKRFTDAQTEFLYRNWREGHITVNVVTETFRKLAPKREVSFRTELVEFSRGAKNFAGPPVTALTQRGVESLFPTDVVDGPEDLRFVSCGET